MQFVSCSTSTILANIHRLRDNKVYEHSRGGLRYMQAFNHHQLFVETDRQDTLEICRVDTQRNDIYFVKQLNVGEVSCVAASKLLYDQLAFGTRDGQVKVINSRTGELLQVLQGLLMPRKVLCLDYNAFDERLAAVNSDGHITVWNTILDRQVQVLDNGSANTVVRFHPRLRLHLACGTTQGTLRVYDTLTWQKVFQEEGAHTDAVTEIALSKGDRNIFLSSGYDGHINIYDMRVMSKVRQINCFSPLGTMCISECARYFGVGSEMGVVATFDMRRTRLCMCASDLHGGPVRGMFFVPSSMYEMPTRAGPMEYPLPNEVPNLLSGIFDEYAEPGPNYSSAGPSTMNRCGQDTTGGASFTCFGNANSTSTGVVWPYTLLDYMIHRPVYGAPENATNGANQVQAMGIGQTLSTSPTADPSSMRPQSRPTTSTALAEGQYTSPVMRAIEEVMLILQEIQRDISSHIPQLEHLRNHVRESNAAEMYRLLCEHSRLLKGLLVKAVAVMERLATIATHTEQLRAENIRMKRILEIAYGPATDQ